MICPHLSGSFVCIESNIILSFISLWFLRSSWRNRRTSVLLAQVSTTSHLQSLLQFNSSISMTDNPRQTHTYNHTHSLLISSEIILSHSPSSRTMSSAALPLISKDPLSFTPSPYNSLFTNKIYSFSIKLGKIDDTHLRFTGSAKRNLALRPEASKKTLSLTQEVQIKKMSTVGNDRETDLFDEMKERFLNFKKLKYLENMDHFQKLANGQSPKFMVIACADSRVCPSNVLGFQPGDAFIIRNVANMVPPFENGPTETNAGLEFAVNSLEVENILVVGHSCCGGIRALMSMQDESESSSSFIGNWVVVGKKARLSVKAAAGNLSFDQQCQHCEKESVNRSLMNLMTYPWIEERVRKGVLSIHGGYYDFVNCTFEKWTLNCTEMEGDKYSIKERQFWS